MSSNIFKKIFDKLRPTIRVDPNGSISMALEFQETLSEDHIDERIGKLSKARNYLLETVQAIDQLEAEAQERKSEVLTLREHVELLETDKKASEQILSMNQESVGRLLQKANKQTSRRSMIIGIIIGLFTGFISSYAVWFLTR